jgi:hypothetical protein
MLKPCHLLLTLILSLQSLNAWGDSIDDYIYDARMSFLKAGELTLELTRSGEQYEVAGEFKTSRAMNNYYSWNGVFAAAGRWEGRGPVTTAYMSRTVSKDEDLKIVLNYQDGARMLEGSKEQFKSIPKPGGVDLISALFFSPTCYEGGEVHDGEDTYKLDLRSQKYHLFKAGEDYYSGEVLSCDYMVRDHKNRKRRVIVSLADINGTKVAVQIRAKIPILPDAVFRLRMQEPEPQVAFVK